MGSSVGALEKVAVTGGWRSGGGASNSEGEAGVGIFPESERIGVRGVVTGRVVRRGGEESGGNGGLGDVADGLVTRIELDGFGEEERALGRKAGADGLNLNRGLGEEGRGLGR